MRQTLVSIRSEQLSAKVGDEKILLDNLISEAEIKFATRKKIVLDAENLVNEIKTSSKVGLLDSILAQYGLATKGGVAILRLAEALMRVPDSSTMDTLIADKLTSVDWKSQRGTSATWLVNFFTVCLQFATFCLKVPSKKGIRNRPRGFLKWISTPFIRISIRFTVKNLAGRFVLGKTMEEALKRSVSAEKKGYLYSYDMLGEAALTEKDADFFFDAYKHSITSLAPKCYSHDYRDNHGISIKLSAMHPRYEWTQRDRVLKELVNKVKTLSLMAKEANMGISIDAEEADRLELSLEVIREVLSSPELEGWDGFGVVVQAYGKSAPFVLDWLYQLAQELDRKIAIRLVKGAYWDYEIKKAQIDGLADFPVYTNKAGTDVSYLCCAKKLLAMSDRVYPQFAGHNAHTVASILEFSQDDQVFEFQRIHGMGEALHELIKNRHNTKCRIYAPVGEHKELLPYLSRRMLENGANSSFLNQLADPDLNAKDIISDPFDLLQNTRERNLQVIKPPQELFGQKRKNSKGWDIHNPEVLNDIETSREPYLTYQWNNSLVASTDEQNSSIRKVTNPANPEDTVGHYRYSTKKEVSEAFDTVSRWFKSTGLERASVLIKASDLYESNAPEIMALLCREAGKTINDAVGEIREAVDFLRYYASQAPDMDSHEPAGIISCISPWNFPLAIFTGQIASALASGNGVIAKASEQTVLIADLAVRLLHQAGVPNSALKLVCGDGPGTGAQIVSDARVCGVAFTGSTKTAQIIQKNMAENLKPSARLVAETGGLNAMIVDSTALPEQVVKDIIVSSFQSAGQRCSALRILYLQKDIEDIFLTMLYGAMDQLRIGDPWHTNTDIGPLIDAPAFEKITQYIANAAKNGQILKQCSVPKTGYFVGPTVIRVNGIEDLTEEIFGPVLHVVTFEASNLDKIIQAVNARGFGLTFGLHSRIDKRVLEIAEQLKIGNIYVNRNQIGAVVGSQPFGGEGLSGTGPKAGGPDLVKSFTMKTLPLHRCPDNHEELANPSDVQYLLGKNANPEGQKKKSKIFPGPTGETNQLNYYPRGTVLCLGPSPEDCNNQAILAANAGCKAVKVCPDAEGPNSIGRFLDRTHLKTLHGFDIVALWSDDHDLRKAKLALAERTDKFIPLAATTEMEELLNHERHVCTDTTAAGGNATLFAQMGNNLPA